MNYFQNRVNNLKVANATLCESYDTNPTTKNYSAMYEAYSFFNLHLFAGELPSCLLTLQRKSRAYGFFAGGRFGATDGNQAVSEIAINPNYIRDRSTEAVLSTLGHEQCHLWQHYFGAPSRSGYHNLEWSTKMKEIGLIPSHNGQPGGRQTGQSMTHYIEPGGPFDRHCRELVEAGFILPYHDLWGDPTNKARQAKNKTKFVCPDCGAAAWGKPNLRIACADCEKIMQGGLK